VALVPPTVRAAPASMVKVLAPPDWRVTAPSPVKVEALIVPADSKVPEIEALEEKSALPVKARVPLATMLPPIEALLVISNPVN